MKINSYIVNIVIKHKKGIRICTYHFKNQKDAKLFISDIPKAYDIKNFSYSIGKIKSWR